MKIILLISALIAVTATAVMAESEFKHKVAINQANNSVTPSFEKDHNYRITTDTINIKVSSIKITVLHNSSFNKQNAIVSAGLDNRASKGSILIE